MKKSEITKEISRRLGIPKNECDKVVETLSEVIKDALANGENVKIRDFVNFEIHEHKARKGYNPYTGETENYAPVRVVKCKIGKNIKNAVKEE